jgi:hypothetical protein
VRRGAARPGGRTEQPCRGAVGRGVVVRRQSASWPSVMVAGRRMRCPSRSGVGVQRERRLVRRPAVRMLPCPRRPVHILSQRPGSGSKCLSQLRGQARPEAVRNARDAGGYAALPRGTSRPRSSPSPLWDGHLEPAGRWALSGRSSARPFGKKQARQSIWALTCRFGARGRIRTDDLPITRRPQPGKSGSTG